MIQKVILGIDLGTSAVKSALFDAQTGTLLGQGSAVYALHHPQPGFAEQDPQDWWLGLIESVRAVMDQAPPGDIAAVGLCGQMHGLVCLDRDQQPLLPAIIWADSRSTAEVEQLSTLQKKSSATLPGPPAAGFAAASALWLKRHQPAILDKTQTILSPKDYLRLRLCGQIGSEPSDASATGLFDIEKGYWAREIVEGCGLQMTQMPCMQASSAVAGALIAEAAAALHLPAGTPIIFGSADVAAQALGHAIMDPSDVLVTLGTGGQVLRPQLKPAPDALGRLHVFNHNLPGRWYALAAILSGGLALRWLRDTLGMEGQPDAYTHLSHLAGQVPPGVDGLLFLPYLAGERTPHMDPQAAGLFLGLRLEHGPGHLARAVMEGVGFALKECLDLLDGDGDAARIILSGGATQSAVWPQMLADIFQRPLQVPQDDLPRACWGAAVLAGVGVGLYDDVAGGTAVRGEHMRVVEPQNMPVYEDRYVQFKRLYPFLKEEMHQLNGT